MININVFVFLSIGIGSIFTVPDLQPTLDITKGLFLGDVHAILAIVSIVYAIMICSWLKRVPIILTLDAKGIGLTAFNFFLIFAITFFAWYALVMIGMVIVGISMNQSTLSDTEQMRVAQVTWYTFFVLPILPPLGFLNATFGPFISLFNIAAILDRILTGGNEQFLIYSTFDFLEFIGIEDDYLKWILVLISTVLGFGDLFISRLSFASKDGAQDSM